MPKMIVSIDGVVIKEIQLTKDRTSLGRRPYNDIVIDNLAVSGEHAVVQMLGEEVHLEDMNSTNGTYVNGRAVKKQLLQNSDVIEVGRYKIKYLAEGKSAGALNGEGAGNGSFDNDASDENISSTPPMQNMPVSSDFQEGNAAARNCIRVMSGAAAGREVTLVKVVTTLGKPGVAVASITKRAQGFVLAYVEGSSKPTLNGTPIGVEPVLLKHGDLMELAGTQMQFVQH